MKRLIIIFLILLFPLTANSIGKIFLCNAAGPLPCTVLEAMPINYFSVLNTYGFVVDANQEIFLSDNQVNRWNIVKISNRGCGGWFGLQQKIGNGTGSVPIAYINDKNQPTHFFECYDTWLIANAWGGLWRTAKDGSGRTQIYLNNLGGGIGIFGGDFDPVIDRVVVGSRVPVNNAITSIDRTGTMIATWAIGLNIRGIGVFNDGRYVIYDFVANQFNLYSGWNGAFVKQINNPVAAGYVTISVDNIHNRAYILSSASLSLIIWDITPNLILVNHAYPVGVTCLSVSYNPVDNFAYCKDADAGAAPADFRIWRYNYDTGVQQSWDGSSWIH